MATIMQRVQYAFSQLLATAMKEYEDTRLRTYLDNQPSRMEELPDWQAEGYALFRMDLRLWGNQLEFCGTAYNWPYCLKEGSKYIRGQVALDEGVDTTTLERGQLLHILADDMQRYIQADTRRLFAPVVEFAIDFEPFEQRYGRWWEGGLSEYLHFEGAEDWLEQLRLCRDEMLQGKSPAYSRTYNICWALKTYVYKNDWPRMQSFLAAYHEKVRNEFVGVQWMLKAVCDQILQDGKLLTPDQQQLFEFTGDILIKRAKDQFEVREGRRLKKIAQTNAQKLRENPELVQRDLPEAEEDEGKDELFRDYKDENIKLCAAYYPDGKEDFFNEGFASRGWVSCDILTENEATYRTAIAFLHQCIQDDFPVRCDFHFSSLVKHYIEIRESFGEKLLFQNEQNQFWANCMRYPGLRDDMRRYVALASKRVNYLSGDEMEEDDSSYRRPDFYAASALALADPTGNDLLVSLARGYASSIDVGYAQDVFHVVETFLNQFGINNENVANLVASNDPFFEVYEEYIDGPKGRKLEALKLFVEYGEREGVDMEYFHEILEEEEED